MRHAGPAAAAYAQYASALPDDDKPVLIALDDPLQALVAFFGILAQGHTCGIGDMDIAKALPEDALHILDTSLPPRDPRDAGLSFDLPPFITFTGGTTGAPKAVQRAQSTWLHSFAHQNVRIGDRVAVFGRLTHSLALYAAIEALNNGADLFLLSDIRPKGQAAALRDNDVTVIYATPTQIKLLANAAPCPAVRQAYIGGGALDADTQAATVTLFPNAAVQAFYGASETSFLTIADAQTPVGSVGKPYPGVQIEIGPDQSIWAKSPMLFNHYLFGVGQLTQQQNGFLSVGDLGRFDDDGNLFILGRADRTVSISDRQVSLDAVEQQVLALPEITFAAALSEPDPKRGHRLLLAIQGNPKDISTLSLPKVGSIHVLDDWPMLASGKTNYTEITRQIKGGKT
jgi:long-chain acyl-CoA synthetase